MDTVKSNFLIYDIFILVMQMKYTKRLYELRTDRDLTQEDIAKILKTTKQTYGKYENGKLSLKIEDLETLCHFYNISADYIIGLINDPKKLK